MIMGKTCKVVVCGTKKSGKTSILEQVIYGKLGPFPETFEDIYEAAVETERGTHEYIRFFDTEGIDSQPSSKILEQLPKHLLPGADGYVIVYSVDDERSFQVAEAIRKEVEQHKEKHKELALVVIGNKCDLTGSRRRVDKVQALNWAAREKVKLFEASAFDRQSLFEPFVHLCSKLNPPQNKSTFPQLTIGRNKQPKE